MSNYRAVYELYFDISINNLFDIHHIDMNRGNNIIDNLILLPKSVHIDLHRFEEIFSAAKNKNIRSFFEVASDRYLNDLFSFKELEQVSNNIYYWRKVKNLATADKLSGFQYGFNYYQKIIDNYGSLI